MIVSIKFSGGLDSLDVYSVSLIFFYFGVQVVVRHQRSVAGRLREVQGHLVVNVFSDLKRGKPTEDVVVGSLWFLSSRQRAGDRGTWTLCFHCELDKTHDSL